MSSCPPQALPLYCLCPGASQPWTGPADAVCQTKPLLLQGVRYHVSVPGKWTDTPYRTLGGRWAAVSAEASISSPSTQVQCTTLSEAQGGRHRGCEAQALQPTCWPQGLTLRQHIPHTTSPCHSSLREMSRGTYAWSLVRRTHCQTSGYFPPCRHHRQHWETALRSASWKCCGEQQGLRAQRATPFPQKTAQEWDWLHGHGRHQHRKHGLERKAGRTSNPRASL